MAYGVPREPDGEPSGDLRNESLQLLAALQVEIHILRRAKGKALRIADELQVEIDDIQQQLGALD